MQVRPNDLRPSKEEGTKRTYILQGRTWVEQCNKDRLRKVRNQAGEDGKAKGEIMKSRVQYGRPEESKEEWSKTTREEQE